MTERLQEGQRVMIRGLPLGVVERVKENSVTVRFPGFDNFCQDIPIDQVIVWDDGVEVEDFGEKAQTTESSTSEDVLLKKRRALESLRYGVAPQDLIEELTIGFEDLRTWVVNQLSALQHDAMRVLEINGPFGSGKSHVLSVIRLISLRLGYLTAWVEVDGKEISFARPDRLLPKTWDSLRGMDFESDTPLLDLHLKVLENGYMPDALASLGLTKIRDNLATIYALARSGNLEEYAELVESVLSSSEDWTAGDANGQLKRDQVIPADQCRLQPLLSRSLEMRPMDAVRALMGYAILAKMAGFRGLVVTFDETEVEANLNKSGHERASEFFKALHRVILQSRVVPPKAPLCLAFATVRLGEPSEEEEFIRRLVQVSEGDVYRLRPLQERSLNDLAQKIFSLYSEVYAVSESYESKITQDVLDLAKRRGGSDSDIVRRFIKWYVGTLDLLLGPPGVKENER